MNTREDLADDHAYQEEGEGHQESAAHRNIVGTGCFFLFLDIFGHIHELSVAVKLREGLSDLCDKSRADNCEYVAYCGSRDHLRDNRSRVCAGRAGIDSRQRDDACAHAAAHHRHCDVQNRFAEAASGDDAHQACCKNRDCHRCERDRQEADSRFFQQVTVHSEDGSRDQCGDVEVEESDIVHETLAVVDDFDRQQTEGSHRR